MRWQEEGGRLTGKSSQKHNEKQKGKAKPTTATRHVGAWGPPRWGSGHVQAVRSPGGQSRQHEGGEPGRGGVATSSQGERAESAQGDAPARGRESPWREDAMAGEPGRTVEGLHGPGEGDRETITQVAASARNEA